MSRLLREPFLHFILLGVFLFWLHGAVAGRPAPVAEAIVVSRGQIENLALTFERTRERPPTSPELAALVDTWVRDEVLYREGVALGIDRDDPVIRNRVRQKMELLEEDSATAGPREADLQAWLDAHPGDYRIEAEVTLDQVYLDPRRHGASLQAVAEQALARLRCGAAEASELGDPTLLPLAVADASMITVERTFGEVFARAVEDAPIGAWQGPIRSDLGLHLFRVSRRTEAHAATLAEVRESVNRDWLRAHVDEAKKAYVERLRRRYTVTLESPPSGLAIADVR